jgi:hypothetical protein
MIRSLNPHVGIDALVTCRFGRRIDSPPQDIHSTEVEMIEGKGKGKRTARTSFSCSGYEALFKMVPAPDVISHLPRLSWARRVHLHQKKTMRWTSTLSIPHYLLDTPHHGYDTVNEEWQTLRISLLIRRFRVFAPS